MPALPELFCTATGTSVSELSNQPIIDGVILNVVVPEAVAINSAITPEPSDGSVPCVLLASAVLAAVSEYILTQHCLSTVTFCNANDLPNVEYATEAEAPSAIELVVSVSETRGTQDNCDVDN